MTAQCDAEIVLIPERHSRSRPSPPKVRVISRGMRGNYDERFSLVHKELTDDGQIAVLLSLGPGRSLSLRIPAAVLEDVEPAASTPPEVAGAAENRVLDRLVP
jgi:hypothetical protein